MAISMKLFQNGKVASPNQSVKISAYKVKDYTIASKEFLNGSRCGFILDNQNQPVYEIIDLTDKWSIQKCFMWLFNCGLISEDDKIDKGILNVKTI